MSDNLPAPLVPAAADLTDFKFMPLEVARLRRSKAWLICKRQPELAFYMVNLWTAAWHSVPAGSLEDDDDVLADAAMCDPHKWSKLRDKILRGWVKCSDGLLYHPVVAEKVAESWQERLEYAWRKECDRIRKENKVRKERGENELEIPAKPERIPTERSGIPAENALKGEVKGQGEDKGKKERTLAPAPVSEPAKPIEPAEAVAEVDPMDEARKVSRAFSDAQVLVYGDLSPRVGNATDEIRCAERWVTELGLTAATAAAIFEAEMRAGAEKGKQQIRSIRYLDGRIRDSFAKDAARAAEQQQSDAAPLQLEDHATAQWRSRLSGFKQFGGWSQAWGEKPPGPGNPRPRFAEYPEDMAVEIGVAGPDGKAEQAA